MTLKEKMDAFYQGAGALAEQLGFKAFVIQIQIDEKSGAASWWPGCGSDCASPLDCTAHAFHHAAHALMNRSDEILENKASVIDGRGTLKN